MNRSFLEKARIDVDLTSLLDVIFIILMVVLCHQQVDANNNQAVMENLQSQISAAEDAVAENVMYEERLDTYENIDEYINLITVYAEYDVSDVTKRYIRIMNGENEIKKIEITPESETEGYAQFEEALKALITESDSTKPVLCSLDLNQILYRDAIKINDIVSKIEDSDLYFKEIRK